MIKKVNQKFLKRKISPLNNWNGANNMKIPWKIFWLIIILIFIRLLKNFQPWLINLLMILFTKLIQRSYKWDGLILRLENIELFLNKMRTKFRRIILKMIKKMLRLNNNLTKIVNLLHKFWIKISNLHNNRLVKMIL